MARYLHGHAPSVLASHTVRTAENSCSYLLPHLREGMRVLDIGCGPATITLDLAERVGASGQVTGIEPLAETLELGRAEAARRGDTRTRFEVGDVFALPYDDGSFDVVHAHQVLQHLTDPVAGAWILVTYTAADRNDYVIQVGTPKGELTYSELFDWIAAAPF